MTYNIIKTDNYLLVVDDSEIKEGDYYLFNWYGEKDIQKFTYEQYSDREKNKYLYEQSCKKIIAHLPLNNSPILESVHLLPPLEQEDDVEKLAIKEVGVDDEIYNSYDHETFNNGYNKAKEKYKFTEEDLGLFLEYVRDNYTGMGAPHLVHNKGGQRKTKAIVQDYIQSLSQPKMPVGFECEIHDTIFGDINTGELLKWKPKTTTNSQGQTVWVGKYIFN